MLPFHSRDKRYKSVIGPLATEQSAVLRVTLPRSISCSGARLVITKENEAPVRYGMFWAGMNGDDMEWWDLSFAATTPGLYWYYFELDTPWGVNEITETADGEGQIGAAGAAFQLTVYDRDFKTPDWLKGGLIYQIFPDRFYRSGEKKGELPAGRVLHETWGEQPVWRPNQEGKILNNDFFGGDLKGIEEKLGYLAGLGVTCVYLNPVFESYSNHRYDTADYMKIDPLLGDEKALKHLCAAAKKRGIHIILDGVFSHTGNDSRYFNAYNRYDTVGAYNSPDSPYYNWYKFIVWPQKYQSWWGIDVLPELIEENPEFQQFVFGENGVLRHWLRCGVSGWRLDVADELPDVFLDGLRACVKAENPEAVIIGEVWEDATTKFAYGQRRRYLLGRQLDSVMNYPFANAVLDFIRMGDGKSFFRTVMNVVDHYPPPALALLMNHIGTHDTERAITRLAGEPLNGRDRSWQAEHTLSKEQYKGGILYMKLASALQYTLPGVPSLYYGDEAGMEGYRDPFNRGCYPWDKPEKKLQRWYQRLGQVRSSSQCLIDGEFFPLYENHDVVCYCRQGRGEALLIAVNRGGSGQEIPLAPEWEASYPVIGQLPFQGVLTLAPYSVTLLLRKV